MAGIPSAVAGATAEVFGTFNATALSLLGYGQTAAERTARATERTAENTSRLLEQSSETGLEFA